MIYLEYIYQQSKLPEPVSIALEIHDTDALCAEVKAEFAGAFPECKLTLSPAQADWHVLVYRRNRSNLPGRINWGRKNKDGLAVGFFCVDDRQFEVIPRAAYSAWARKERIIVFLAGLFRANFVGKNLFRLVDRLLWLKESF